MQPDSFVLTSTSLAEFYRRQPIDFFLYDEEGNANLYILNDNVPGKTHHLILANESEQELSLRPAPRNQLSPGPGNFHFELRFRPGALARAFYNWITVGSAEWRLRPWLWTGDPVIADGTVSLFLLYALETELVLPARGSRLIPLHGLKSGIEGGSRGVAAELRYHRKAQEIVSLEADRAGAGFHARLDRFQVINQRGVRDIPLRSGFNGGNRVLNNGNEENRLHLQLTNLLRNNVIPMQGLDNEVPSRFVLSFDTSAHAEHWALLDEDNALNIQVEMNNDLSFWHIEKETQGQTVQWILTPADDLEVDAGQSLRIDLSQIISNMPAGTANLYLSYENIPGYWDGGFTVPIDKTPFYLQEQFDDEKGNVTQSYVGIGTHQLEIAATAEDFAPLQVQGGIRADFLALKSGGVIPRGGIIMWSGTTANVPRGWQLCDGNNGQPVDGLAIPDLRSRFIVGAGQGNGLSGYTPDQTGGTEQHILTESQIPAHTHGATATHVGEHTHDIPLDDPIQDVSNSIDFPHRVMDGHTRTAIKDVKQYIEKYQVQNAGSHTHFITVNNTGGGQAHENRPPFYALAFIIKL